MSGLANLSQCMVDSDPEALARARRLRQKALVISVVLEAVCLAVMLLWPLITPGVLPKSYIMTPLPPYHGGGNPRVAAQPHPTRDRGPRPLPVPNTSQIIFRPNHSQASADSQPPSFDPNVDVGAGDGSGPVGAGPGPIVPGGSDNGPRVEPPRPSEPVRPVRRQMSEGVMAGALIHRVEPVYPVIARTMHLSGTVRLRAIIATDGSIQHLEVLSGSEILARAALDAVRQWRYRPTLLSGVPVEIETYITVTFVLGDH
jgi:protein TonB